MENIYEETLTDCRRYLASLINLVEDNAIEPEVAGKIGFMVHISKGFISEAKLEQWLKKLEDAHRDVAPHC